MKILRPWASSYVSHILRIEAFWAWGQTRFHNLIHVSEIMYICVQTLDKIALQMVPKSASDARGCVHYMKL